MRVWRFRFAVALATALTLVSGCSRQAEPVASTQPVKSAKKPREKRLAFSVTDELDVRLEHERPSSNLRATA